MSTSSEYYSRKKRIHSYLGGENPKCALCGKESGLHVDHVDHFSKSFSVLENWSTSWDRLVSELEKCQLLCKSCHLEKSVKEGSLAKGWTNEPRQVHGTCHSYIKYKCRCVECKAAKSEYEKQRYYSNK